MATERFLCDLSNPAERNGLLRQIGALRGWHRIEWQPYRGQRSSQANRYYWGVLVASFFSFLQSQDYQITSKEDAHSLLKCRFLKCDVFDPVTGEVVGERIRSTTELDTAEFARYVDACRQWLLEFFSITVPDPSRAE